MEKKFERRDAASGSFFKEQDGTRREARPERENRSFGGGREDRPRRSFNPNFTNDNRPRFNSDRRDDRRSGSGENSGERREFRPRENDGERREFRPRENNGERREFRPRENNGERREFRPRENNGERREFRPRENNGERREFRPRENNGERREFRPRENDGERREFRPRENNGERREFRPRENNGEHREFHPRENNGERREFRPRENNGERREFRPRENNGERREFRPRENNGERREFRPRENNGERREFRPRDNNGGGFRPRTEEGASQLPRIGKRPRINSMDNFKSERTFRTAPAKRMSYTPEVDPNNYVPEPLINREIRLNRYVAMSGVCSRREADNYIAQGLISVNGEVVTELGTKVKSTDEVSYNGSVIRGEKKVYIVMNKPKGFVTTVEDDHAERTVIDLLKGQVEERVYPVGRLDKSTMGVLLLTNDGDMTKVLTHPSYNKKKIYHVVLDKSLAEDDMERIAQGVELEDGVAFADEIAFIGDGRKEVGLEIHSGRNRIVRRLFEHFDYRVMKLDRVYFAGITKKGLQRGFWRHLTPKEVQQIKLGMYN